MLLFENIGRPYWKSINKVNFEFFSGYKLNSGKVLERLNSWFWGSDAHIDNERFLRARHDTLRVC